MKFLKAVCALAGVVLALHAPAVHAQFNSLSAQPNSIFVGTPTSVKFVADMQANPALIGASVQLLKETNGSFLVVGTMYDDGSHGDSTPNDKRFTLVTTAASDLTGQLNYRVSAAYRGSAQRVQSSVLPLLVTPALDLRVTPGQPSVTLKEGESVATAFTLDVSKRSAGPATIKASQRVSSSAGLSVVTDLSDAGFYTTETNQTFLVQDRITALKAGSYTLTLSGTLTAADKTVNSTSTINVKVLPASGVGSLVLSAHPGGLQANTKAPIFFGVRYSQGSTLPTAVYLDEVTATGSPIARIGTLSDNGVAPDKVASDQLYSAKPQVTAGAAGALRYFKAVASFPGGATVSSPLLTLSTLPFSPVMQPVQANTVQQDPSSGQHFVCDQMLVSVKPGTTAAQVQALAASVRARIVGAEPGANTYQFALACTGLSAIKTLATQLQTNPIVAAAAPNRVSTVEELKPNDTRYAEQWSPIKVRADEAWMIGRGTGVVVAVLDTGVDYNHPDLAGRVIKGSDFVNNDADPQDDHSHGTHVAGIIAAAGNNGVGVAGMAWDARILAIKICGAKSASVPGAGWVGGCPDSAEVSGIMEAYPQAKIINMSLGGLTGSTGVKNAIAAAISSGVMVVAAAGNNGNSAKMYPCSFDNVLCVGNSGPADTRSSSSSYGTQVDIAAPGESILSTVPSFENATGYSFKTGTSMATPLVAGLAALVWANNPTWTRAQVEERLIKTAVPLPSQQIGPRVDAFNALFNGSFEHGLSGWQVSGTGSAVTKLGPISPTHNSTFGMASTGPDGSVTASELYQSFTLQSGVTELALSFHYALVSEEYPEFVRKGFNDTMVITLVKPDGNTVQIATESVDNASFASVSGIDFPGGDKTVGWTGWKTVNSVKIPITPGPGTYRLRVEDRGDGKFDTNALLDNIHFR